MDALDEQTNPPATSVSGVGCAIKDCFQIAPGGAPQTWQSDSEQTKPSVNPVGGLQKALACKTEHNVVRNLSAPPRATSVPEMSRLRVELAERQLWPPTVDLSDCTQAGVKFSSLLVGDTNARSKRQMDAALTKKLSSIALRARLFNSATVLDYAGNRTQHAN